MFIQLSLIVVCLYISLQHEHSLYGMAYSHLIVFGTRRNLSKFVGSLKLPSSYNIVGISRPWGFQN